MGELFCEVIDGELKKVHDDEENSELDVKLDVEDFYDQMPSEDLRAQKGRERVKQINEDFHRFKEQMEEKKRAIEMKKAEKEALEAQFKKSLEK